MARHEHHVLFHVLQNSKFVCSSITHVFVSSTRLFTLVAEKVTGDKCSKRVRETGSSATCHLSKLRADGSHKLLAIIR